MITPQQLKEERALSDQEEMVRLETAIDSKLKKYWEESTNHVVLDLLPGQWTRRVVNKLTEKYRQNGWRIIYSSSQKDGDSLTFSAETSTCHCPSGNHIRGCYSYGTM